MDKICCNCANLKSRLEAVGPNLCFIVHICEITGQETKWNGRCEIGAFISRISNTKE